MAVKTLWFMQASLQDLSASPTSQSFLVCQRTLHKCHEIIFAELSAPPSGPYSDLAPSHLTPFARRKVKHRVEPVLVGIGLILAGAPAFPALTEVMSEVALQQGRAEDDGVNLRSLETDDDLVRGIPADPDSVDDDDIPDENPDNDNTREPDESRSQTQPMSHCRRTVTAAQTSPALVHLRSTHRSRLSGDPFDQQDPLSGRVSSPYQSSPSISSSLSPLKQNVTPAADALLQKYDLQSQSYLLRSHYCRSEVCPPLSFDAFMELTYPVSAGSVPSFARKYIQPPLGRA